jgi:hypothetical protein
VVDPEETWIAKLALTNKAGDITKQVFRLDRLQFCKDELRVS